MQEIIHYKRLAKYGLVNLKGEHMFEAERNLIFGIVLIFGVLVGGLSYLIYSDSQAEKFELNKSEWECTKSRTDLIAVPQTVGNSTIVQFYPMDVCERYEKK